MADAFVPYNKRPEWQDITPIPQDDGPNPLVLIAYSSDYTDAMNYFRAISSKNELSERALDLTTQIIGMNPAHYTIWNYRQNLLLALNKDLHAELEFIDELSKERSKNYQVWYVASAVNPDFRATHYISPTITRHHRQVVVERLNDSSRELPFIAYILEEDSKNYHAWSYRQWVITRFDLWSGELPYLDELLIIDVRNNSAWNHRYFVVFEGPTKPTQEFLEKEIEFTKGKIRLAPNNQSSWNYLKGILARSPNPTTADDILASFCAELRDSEIVSSHLLASLVDVSEARAKRGDKTSLNQGVKVGRGGMIGYTGSPRLLYDAWLFMRCFETCLIFMPPVNTRLATTWQRSTTRSVKNTGCIASRTC
ncbi:hypothetical protein BC938DRAFT_480314 [Jimgerdemannia flammicorona]|uniref:Protein farnesyltransferase/geranylgeranyltransferase type-1 subunit alpha n=1 Tax=Jimgerdemannia flammicorona TaxID=994334 RepID=A0A433QIV2_9FUNG|nr:hypothetical protein BC938DRAFT_480314 [Jimgerdemannia flammicorona]